MSANFAPELKGYSGVRPFRAWVQMVLPQVYDDALSYQELVYKMLYYLKNLIDDVDNCESNIYTLKETYEKLETFVNEYFNDLDITDEINAKLDTMVENGELQDILVNYLIPYKFILNLDGVEDENIAATINTALETYYEVQLIPGEYNITETIVIPNCRILDGNNSSLTLINSTSTNYCVVIGTNSAREPDTDENNIYSNHKCELKNITVNANNAYNGITIACRGARMYSVKVVNVGSSCTGVKINTPTSGGTNSDAYLEGVSVNNPSTPYSIGFDIYGDDNQFVRCDTYRSKIGADMHKNGNYFTNCHFLAMSSESYPDTWLNSIGWYYENTGRSYVELSNCYADNFRYAVVCEGGAALNVSLRHYFWETSYDITRYGITTKSDCYGSLTLEKPSLSDYVGFAPYANGITVLQEFMILSNMANFMTINTPIVAANYNKNDFCYIGKPYSLNTTNSNTVVNTDYGMVLAYFPVPLYEYLNANGIITGYNFILSVNLQTSNNADTKMQLSKGSYVYNSTNYDLTISLAQNDSGDYLLLIDTESYEGVINVNLNGYYLTLPFNLATSPLDLKPTELITSLTLSPDRTTD